MTVLIAIELGQAHSGAQFPQLSLLFLGNAQGLIIQFLGNFGMTLP
jgi:hypothetical protein